MKQFTQAELHNLKSVKIAVIGPTNEGKTSVLRTLTGDPNFGEISALSGTTKKSLIQKIFYNGVELLQLIDTPGFQMSGEILNRLDERNETSMCPEDILNAIPADDVNYAHDFRAWKEISTSDIIVYVANIMETPKQSLISDSLDLLIGMKKPILVLFNNVPAGRSDDLPTDQSSCGANPESTVSRVCIGEVETIGYWNVWISELRRRRIYTWQIYDAHRRDFENEVELLEKLCVYIDNPPTKRALKLEIENRHVKEERRMSESREIICNLLMELACEEQIVNEVRPENRQEKVQEAVEALNRSIYEMELKAHIEILKSWEFGTGILDRKLIEIKSKTEEANDLLGKDAFEHYISGAGLGTVIGAGIGLTLDAALAGLSLGTGAMIGALVGGALGGGISGFQHIHYDKATRIITAVPAKEVLHLLFGRAVELVRKLQSRGKALEDGVQILVSRTPEPYEDRELLNLLTELVAAHSQSKSFFFRLGHREKTEDLRQKLLRHLEKLLPSP